MPAIGKSKVKRYSKSNTTKKSSKQSDSKGWFKWEREGRGRKKVYTKLFKTRQPGIEASNVRKHEGSFADAFKKHKSAGDKKFTWKGKQYHTKTKSELEGAIGAKEKERFARAGKSKETTKKKGLWAKIKSLGSSSEGKADRVKAKRIAWMEKRKDEGKSYSKKNLAELKGSEKKPTYITKKKKSYSISS